MRLSTFIAILFATAASARVIPAWLLDKVYPSAVTTRSDNEFKAEEATYVGVP